MKAIVVIILVIFAATCKAEQCQDQPNSKLFGK